MERAGMLLVYTGQGKGKTTAALGTVVRAMGWGHKPCVVQYVKGKWQTGERRFFEKAASLESLEYHVMGLGFTWESDDISRDKEAARAAWELSAKKIMSGKTPLVVLDEITYVINYGFISLQEVLGVFADRPPSVTVLVTGRKCPEEIMAAADLVTEMKDVKHPYKKGYKALKGVDF